MVPATLIEIVATVLAALLSAVAIVHLYWALGGIWPAKSERDLVNAVFGVPGAAKMPGAKGTLVVVLALAVAAAWPLFISGTLVVPVPRLVLTMVGAVFAAVFWIRGIAAYLPKFRSRFSSEPFATLDRVVYAPFSLAICAGYLSVVFFSRAG